MAVSFEVIVSEPFSENAYIFYQHDPQVAGKCLVVDPGSNTQAILAQLDSLGLVPEMILNTHGHGDHIAGNADLKKRWPAAPLAIGRGDAEMLTDPVKNLSGLLGIPVVSPAAERLLVEGEVLEVAGFSFEVREIPGHSPGHIVLVCQPQHGSPWVIGGDVLFAGSIGRSDFPGGSHQQLVEGIHSKLWPLPDETVVYPGHGEPTTIGQEKQTNPFVRVA